MAVEIPNLVTEFAFEQDDFLLAQNVLDTVIHHRGLIFAANRALPETPITEFYIRPVTEQDKLVLQAFKETWEITVGVNGYMRKQLLESELQTAKKLLLTGFFLGFYGHQDHSRKSGEPFYIHPTTAALHYAQEHRGTAVELAAIYVHDTVEDTLKKNKTTGLPYAYPVNFRNIAQLLGTEVALITDGLTKVGNTQSRKRTSDSDDGVVATRMKLVESLKTDPRIALLKVAADRWHNMETIRFLKPDKQINYAQDTRFHIGLGRRMGLPETSEIEDEAFAILYPRVTAGINAARVEKIDVIDILESEKTVYKFLNEAYGRGKIIRVNEHDVHVSIPTTAEIRRTMNGSRVFSAEHLHYCIDIVIEDQSDEEAFYDAALDIFTALGKKGTPFTVPSGANVGMVDSLTRTRHEQDIPYFQFVLRDEYNQRIQLRVYQRSPYDLEHTPLSYLYSVDLHPEDAKRFGHIPGFLEYRRELARKRLITITAELDHLREEAATDETFTDKLADFLPDEIEVTGQKRFHNGSVEEKSRPLKGEATLLDYILQAFPERWQEVEYAEINGHLITDFSVQLQHHDVIWCKFGKQDSNFIEPNWLDALGEGTQDFAAAQTKIITALQAKVAKLEARVQAATSDLNLAKNPIAVQRKRRSLDQAEAELIVFQGMIEERGRWLFAGIVGELSQKVLYKDAARVFPDGDPNAFFYNLGLNLVEPQTITVVKKAFEEFWDNLEVCVVRVPSMSGMLQIPAEVFGSRQLNIVYTSSFPLQAAGLTSFEFRFDKQTDNFNLLDEAIEDIVKTYQANTDKTPLEARKELDIQRFPSDTEYTAWIVPGRSRKYS